MKKARRLFGSQPSKSKQSKSKQSKSKQSQARSRDRDRDRDHRISAAPDDAETTFPLSEWMIPATDSHGHSAKLFTRVPPSYKHAINVILQKKRYPWETESDLVRVAVHRLLDAVAKDSRDPEIMSQQALLNSMMEMSSRQMEFLHFKESMDKLSSVMQQLIAVGATPVARKQIAGMREYVEQFEDEYWRGRFKSELDRFSAALKD